jgi:hypothetical protein
MALKDMTGGIQNWMPKTPTTTLAESSCLKPNAMDDPECTPGKESVYTPFKRGNGKPSEPFGLATPGNKET